MRVFGLLVAAVLLGGADYVAMGSSFAAGPGIGVRAVGAPAACRQSASNYAHLLAARRGWSLADESCSGATSFDVLAPSPRGQPAQLAAVGPDTRVVTLTVGGNDVHYMRNLWAWSCEGARDAVPFMARRMVCRAAPPSEIEQAFAGLEDRFVHIVQQIHARAPHARIIFVDYVSVLPEKGQCAAAPLSLAHYSAAREIAARLLAITHKAAAETDSGLVRAADLTAAHHVCAPDPWITGFAFSRGVDGFGVIPYHPTQASMDAVAAALDAYLGK